MKNRKKLISLLAGIMAAVMILGLIMSVIPVASAESSSEIRQQITELEALQAELEYEMSALEEQYQENEDEIANLVNQKMLIDQEIALMLTEIDVVNQQIAAYNMLIADMQDELDAAQAELDRLTEENRERIRAMEEEGSLSYWAVLFAANSFSDLLDRMNMVEEIAAADQRRLDEMNAAAEAVALAQQELETEKAALEATMAELDVLYAELEAKRAESDRLLQELLARGAEIEALFEEYEQLESELLTEIGILEQEYNEAKQREWEEYMATYTTVPPETTAPPTTGSTNNSTGTNEGTTATTPTTPENGGGTDTTPEETTPSNNPSSSAVWLVPCSYVKLTSPYGWREPPTSGASSFHQGVDLAGPEGTPIYATRSGVVTTARFSRAGGNYVTINHGDGFSSSYLHLTNYVVSPGQAVSAGQLIGYMGNTGISTGSHLHFAIYFNGSSVNPALYVNLS